MKEVLTFLVIFVGSVSLFLFGLKYMSESMQKVFGKNMRKLISLVSDNKWKNMGVGIVLTSVTQSTSAVTVTAMNFVHNGIYTLKQAFEILLGASIGNTFPIWIFAIIGFNFNLQVFSFLLLFIGFVLLVKKDIQIKTIGEVLIGFALMYLAFYFFLQIIDLLAIYKTHIFNEINNYGIAAYVMLLVIGSFFAVFIKSMSLMSVLTMILAYKGIISIEYSIVLILGENIGKTFSAIFATKTADKRAKQVAWFYSFINVFAAVWVMVILTKFIFFIDNTFVFIGLKAFNSNPENIPYAICLFLTIYNLANSLLISVFVNKIVSITNKSNKVDNKMDRNTIANIESGYLNTSELNFWMVKKEILKFSELTKEMFLTIPDLLSPREEETFKRLLRKLYEFEELNDKFEIDIAKLLIKLSNHELSHETQSLIRKMRRVALELEKLGDICLRMGQLIENKNTEKAYFTPEQREKITQLFAIVEESFDLMIKNLMKDNKEIDYVKAVKLAKSINLFHKNIKQESIEEINLGLYPAKSGFYYNKLTGACEKMGKTILCITAVLTGVEQE